MSAEIEYEKLVEYLNSTYGSESDQMFGKKCIKINGKAAVALFKDCIVFKLPDPHHKRALSLAESVLWDPSGKNRSMKEWVQVSVKHKAKFKDFATAAAEYVG